MYGYLLTPYKQTIHEVFTLKRSLHCEFAKNFPLEIAHYTVYILLKLSVVFIITKVWLHKTFVGSYLTNLNVEMTKCCRYRFVSALQDSN